MDILVNLLVGAVICWCIWLIINFIPLPQPFKQVILIIFGLMVFLWLLGVLGIYDSPYRIRLNT